MLESKSFFPTNKLLLINMCRQADMNINSLQIWSHELIFRDLPSNNLCYSAIIS